MPSASYFSQPSEVRWKATALGTVTAFIHGAGTLQEKRAARGKLLLKGMHKKDKHVFYSKVKHMFVCCYISIVHDYCLFSLFCSALLLLCAFSQLPSTDAPKARQHNLRSSFSLRKSSTLRCASSPQKAYRAFRGPRKRYFAQSGKVTKALLVKWQRFAVAV